jgi:hypothetical protein
LRERNNTKNEILSKVQKKAFEALDECVDKCLPTLAARLWATCSWPRAMSDGWKIGDYNFLILSAAAEKDTEIYVQYWSEPQEVVSAEVSSGEWSPETLKYVRRQQREFLKTLGFEIGGRAKNFQKQITISTAAQAEATAREALKILYDGFGYRGQWQLNLKTIGARGQNRLRPIHLLHQKILQSSRRRAAQRRRSHVMTRLARHWCCSDTAGDRSWRSWRSRSPTRICTALSP